MDANTPVQAVWTPHRLVLSLRMRVSECNFHRESQSVPYFETADLARVHHSHVGKRSITCRLSRCSSGTICGTVRFSGSNFTPHTVLGHGSSTSSPEAIRSDSKRSNRSCCIAATNRFSEGSRSQVELGHSLFNDACYPSLLLSIAIAYFSRQKMISIPSPCGSVQTFAYAREPGASQIVSSLGMVSVGVRTGR